MRVGSKKTAFANFSEIAKMLHRQPKVWIRKSTSEHWDSFSNLSICSPSSLLSWVPVVPLTAATNSSWKVELDPVFTQFYAEFVHGYRSRNLITCLTIWLPGRFQQKHIENVLRRYIKEYVTCHTCRWPNLVLNPFPWIIQVGSNNFKKRHLRWM